jgi:ABC-type multidrug transport system fused ATPase/permease subunit
MTSVRERPMKAPAKENSVPTSEAVRLLFTASSRRKLILAIIGTAVMALIDAAGVVAILPLMQLLTGAPRNEGLLGWISQALGDPSDQELAVYLAAFTFGAFLIKGVSAIIFRWWFLGFVAREEASTSTRLLRYYLDAPYGLHLRRSSADLIRTMNDAVRGVYSQVVVSTMNIISEAFTILAVSITLFILVPVPALLLIIYFAVAAVILLRVVRPMARRAGNKMLSSWMRIYQDAMHSLGGVKEIKIRHVSGFFLQSYSRGRTEYAEAQRTAGFLGEFPKYVFEVLFIFGIGVITVFIFSTAPSSQSISVLAVLAAAGFRLLPSAVRLVGSLNVARLGVPALDLVVADLRPATESEAVAERHAGQSSVSEESAPEGTIELDRVTFIHDGRERAAVQDVSITIPQGSAVALVGASGAGKTTIVDLLLGLYTPTAGAIRVGGADIHTVLPEWQKRVGLVPQEVYLLDDTLRANIAFGEEPTKTDGNRLARAVAAAQLDGVVASLQGGLDSLVGERGARLSGGQRQRIGIARALYPEPKLLVLDEATSALDNETERRIADTIAGLRGQVTMVVVAHRLSTVRDCDAVVFMKDGEVAGIGSFDDLQVSNADFAHLVELGSLK